MSLPIPFIQSASLPSQLIRRTAFSPKSPIPPVFLYSFNQTDLLSPDPVFKDQAYHSLDNPFLFYLPPVACSSAPPAFRGTVRAYSKACVDLVNGDEPWEVYGVERRTRVFDGEDVRLISEEEGNVKRWGAFSNTDERAEMFTGRVPLMYNLMYEAMMYATGLP
jgi:hypothetical protein